MLSLEMLSVPIFFLETRIVILISMIADYSALITRAMC